MAGFFKVRSDLYTAIAFLPVSEYTALRFSQASIKPEKYGSVEANAPSNRDVPSTPSFPATKHLQQEWNFPSIYGI